MEASTIYESETLPYAAQVPKPASEDVPAQSTELGAGAAPDNLTNLDTATAEAIALAQNEYSTRRAPKSLMAVEPSPTAMPASPSPPAASPMPPATAAPKKRPAPKNTNKSANKKPPSKKHKSDADHDRATPASQHLSPTPSSIAARGASKPKGPRARKASASATPALDDQSDADSDASSVEDPSMVYCICRKPDNHTWMIGCDGGCEDWFHGKCIHIEQQDEDLIDRYICPNCTANGVGVTTWKPMCRRDGCRRPARLRKGAESKYCCDECGVKFMKSMLKNSGALKATSKPSVKSSAFADGPDLGPFGGAIRVHELKTLVDAAPSADIFRRLGAPGTLTPPASPRDEKHSALVAQDPPYTRHEQERVAEIASATSRLRTAWSLLKDREQFVVMAKERASQHKDICGYDPRLAWDEVTFREWRESEEGRIVFERGSLIVDGAGDAEEDGTAPICRRKRCSRHNNGSQGKWQKLALQDVRFEEAAVSDEMKDIVKEGMEIRRIAVARARLRNGAQHDAGGTVEAVDEDEIMGGTSFVG